MLFHGGTGPLMGLVMFAIEAAILQLAFSPDISYRAVAASVARAGQEWRAAVYNSERTPGISSEA